MALAAIAEMQNSSQSSFRPNHPSSGCLSQTRESSQTCSISLTQSLWVFLSPRQWPRIDHAESSSQSFPVFTMDDGDDALSTSPSGRTHRRWSIALMRSSSREREVRTVTSLLASSERLINDGVALTVTKTSPLPTGIGLLQIASRRHYALATKMNGETFVKVGTPSS